MVKRKQEPQIITEEEFSKILYIIISEKKKKTYSGNYQVFCKLRDCMVYSMMFYLGLRPKECYEAKKEHINLDKKEWLIPYFNNKQRQTDIIPIPDFIFDKLLNYIEFSNNCGFSNSEWLFPTKHYMSSGRLSRSSINDKFNYYCNLAGLSRIMYKDADGMNHRNLHPYCLRHSFGTHAYEVLGDINKVRILMRHKDIRCRATFLYVHITDNNKRKEFLDNLYENKASSPGFV